MESRYVREEVNKALELDKTIFPVIYRATRWTGEFETLTHEIQTLDLRSGSYTDNFQKLVDGLIEAGAGKQTAERPFLRSSTQPDMGICLEHWLAGLLDRRHDSARHSGGKSGKHGR